MKNVYVKTYFRIEVGYKWGEGHSEDQSDTFNNELERIFAELGFDIQVPKSRWTSYTVTRGKERLYCHPMNLSGEVFESSIAEIEEALKGSDVIKYRFTDTYDKIYEYTREDVLELLENNYRDKTIEMILNTCRTTRKNKYKAFNYDSFNEPIKTIDKEVGENTYIDFFKGIVNELVDQGLLLKMNNESDYYRTLNKTEMKLWERKNGSLELNIA